jgi:hypothetical protein
VADQCKGGLRNYSHAKCMGAGMPLMMNAFFPEEYIITPTTTYILINYDDHSRRIFTDGRNWPKEAELTFQGYSIGKWIDEDGDGRYERPRGGDARALRGTAGPLTRRGCRCTSTIDPSLKSGSISMPAIPISSMTKSP